MLPLGVINKKEELKNPNLQKIYEAVNNAYEKWQLKHISKPRVKDPLIGSMNIVFTIADDDWVYRELLEMIIKETNKLELEELK